MGNCAGYCNGADDNDAHQVKNSFNKNFSQQDLSLKNQNFDGFETKYAQKCKHASSLILLFRGTTDGEGRTREHRR